MRKIFYSLMVLFMGITSASFAQQEEATTITTWTGDNLKVSLNKGKKKTYKYTANADGTLYIYADDQSVNDNVPLSIWGGRYLDGAYTTDSLQEAGNYENGVGVYGWINVKSGDIVRFTITASAEAGSSNTRFTLKSLFFTSNAGNSWKSPIKLTKDTKASLPTFTNSLEFLDEPYATCCSFTAPSNGVASIVAKEYLIYYMKAENMGTADNTLQYASQDDSTDDHEFMVEGGKEYLVFIPNSRPTEVTFKMTQDRLGLSEKFPIEINEFPATIDLTKGNNYYRFKHTLIKKNTTMEINVAAGWNGTITYLEGTERAANASEELTTNAVKGSATTFIKNIDTRFLNGDAIVVNFNMTDKTTMADAAILTLRAPTDGESFNTAIKATLGENHFDGPVGSDHWFAYTAENDVELSFESSATIRHINFTAGIEDMVRDENGDLVNKYRTRKGQTIYVCLTTTKAGDNTLTISSKDVMPGDYLDNPVIFELGQSIVLKDRGDGVSNYWKFTAEKSGFAIFNTESQIVLDDNWSVNIRKESNGNTLDYTKTDNTNLSGTTISRTYKLPVTEGNSYIVDITSYVNGGKDVTFTSKFEAASAGEICATAIELEKLDTLKLDYTFNKERWHKITVDKSGFYTVYAKLGYAGNMKTKVGDCDAQENNVGSDNTHKNYYMGGYKIAKVYIQEGQTLYIYTKTGSENDEEQFGAGFYMGVAYSGEARPGEDVAVAIEAQPNTEYAIMTSTDGYEQWYVYTIPAGEELTFTLSATMKFISNSLRFYKEDKTTSMSTDKSDYTQTNLTNEANEIIGKNYTFAAADTDRTIYIKVSTVNAMYNPVVWKIECNESDLEEIIIPVTNITLDYEEHALKEGQMFYLTATVSPSDATDKTITWSSSNDAVATVDENGKVTAIAAGKATITAKAEDKEATCVITVTPKVTPVDELTLNLNADTLVVGHTSTLIATILPEDATDKVVTWSSSNDAIVTVDDSGKITAVAVGTADITATAGNKSATCSIVVIAKEDTEGIEFGKADEKTPIIYDLMGRKVTAPTKGIYIINGVKRIIK